jgi:hypothetical protein
LFFEFFPTGFLIGVIHSLNLYIVSDVKIMNISELYKCF